MRSLRLRPIQHALSPLLGRLPMALPHAEKVHVQRVSGRQQQQEGPKHARDECKHILCSSSAVGGGCYGEQ